MVSTTFLSATDGLLMVWWIYCCYGIGCHGNRCMYKQRSVVNILLLWHWLPWQQVHVQTKECGGYCRPVSVQLMSLPLPLFTLLSLSTPLYPPVNAPPLLSLKVFALEYFKQETGGLIKSEDGAYMLSFAIMMLHTSLHNPSVRHRTTKKQWVSMNRGQWVSVMMCGV